MLNVKRSIISVLCFVRAMVLRNRVTRAATALTMASAGMLVSAGASFADTTPTDPTGGAGAQLVNDGTNAVEYAIGAVGALIALGIAFKLITKLVTRFAGRV